MTSARPSETFVHRGIAREGYQYCTDNDCKCHMMPPEPVVARPSKDRLTLLEARLGTILNIAEGGLTDKALPEIARLAREALRAPVEDTCVKCGESLPPLAVWSVAACPKCEGTAHEAVSPPQVRRFRPMIEAGHIRAMAEVGNPNGFGGWNAEYVLASDYDELTRGELKAAVLPTEICPTGDDYPHKAHKGKCMYCGAPMPSSSEDAV